MSRALLAASGLLVAASLFLPWFDGISGWEQWAWADVVLAVLAAGLVAAAFLRPLAAHRVVLALLCALGAAAVLGHGFEPRPEVDGLEEGALDVRAGAYLCLAALTAGVVAALAPWPRRAGRLLLVAGATAVVGALFSPWAGERMREEYPGGMSEWARAYPDGFARWGVLDVALVAIAVGLLVVATGRAPRLVSALVGGAGALAAVCIAVSGDRYFWRGEGGFAWGLAPGSLLALAALVAALAGAALLERGRAPRRPAPAGRAG